MYEDDNYVEVDAVIRMPKGERLADSKKTEGWSRGFTPKSTDKGPEYVEIRLKDNDEDTKSGRKADDPQITFNYESFESSRQRTPEEEEFDEMLRLLTKILPAVRRTTPPTNSVTGKDRLSGSHSRNSVGLVSHMCHGSGRDHHDDKELSCTSICCHQCT